MKKAIITIFTLLGLNSYSQNTIPTTTCTGAMKINDSLNVNKDITALGDITSKGEVVSTDTLRAKEDVIASKDVKVDGSVYIGDKLNVAGQSIFDQEVTIKKSILFDGGNELSFAPATANSRATFYLGNSAAKPLPWVACPNPNTNALPQFINPGAFISRVPLGSGNPNVNSALSFFSAPWDGTGVIEVDGVDNNGGGNNGLLINYFCGRNTAINTGWDIPNGKDGGTVFMGAKVDMQSSLKIGWTQSGIIDLLTSLDINQNQNNANGVRVNTWNTRVKAYSILRNDGKNTFVVYGDGKTRIGVQNPKAPHDDAMLGVDGKIACKSLYVLKPTSWADYVFKKKELEKLENVEKFINQNKHLPDVPSEEEILNNGYDINEMDAKLLAKIETLYLHIIALEKEINQLKNK